MSGNPKKNVGNYFKNEISFQKTLWKKKTLSL